MSNKLIGTDPNQVPTNADLGTLAFQDSEFPSLGNLRLTGSMIIGNENTDTNNDVVTRNLTLPAGSSGDLFLFGPSPEIGFLDANANRSSAVGGNDGRLDFFSYHGPDNTALAAVVDGTAKATSPSNLMMQMSRVELDANGAYSSGGNLDVKLGNLYLTGTNPLIGIGTNDPKRPLQIGATGSFPISFNGNYPDIHFNTYYESGWRVHTAGFGAKTTFNGATGAFGFSNVASTQVAGANFTPLERLTILANGNVGISTNAPTATLHVNTQIGANGGGSASVDYPLVISQEDVGNTINQADGAGVGILFKNATNSTAAVGSAIASMRASASDDNTSCELAFLVSDNDSTLDEVVRIDVNGQVGIGTISPISKLHVDDSSGAVISLSRTASNTSGMMGTIRFGNLNWDSNLVEIVAVQDSANDAAYLDFMTQNSGAATATHLRINRYGTITHYKETNFGSSINVASTGELTGCPFTHVRLARIYGSPYNDRFEARLVTTGLNSVQKYVHLITDAGGSSHVKFKMFSQRSGSEYMMGASQFEFRWYSEGDGDFRQWDVASFENVGHFSNGFEINGMPYGFLVDEDTNLDASSETARISGTSNWGYAVVRIPVYFSSNSAGTDEIYFTIDEHGQSSNSWWVGIA